MQPCNGRGLPYLINGDPMPCQLAEPRRCVATKDFLAVPAPNEAYTCQRSLSDPHHVERGWCCLMIECEWP